MTGLFRSLAAALLLLFCWMALSPPGFAQTSTEQTPPPSSPPTAKKKKVWTEDDLGKIRGGVSVVGEADKPPAKTKGKKPATSEIAKAEEALEEEPPERPPCKSWSWAAAVDSVLAAQGVNYGRAFWVSKSFGGEICTTELGSVAALASRVSGDYVLEDGSKVRIQGNVFPGFPSGNDLVASQDSGALFIVAWKGHPYVATNSTGVRRTYTGPGGQIVQVDYVVETVDLVDPYEDSRVIFNSDKDRTQDIQGAVQFVVKRP